MMPLKQVRTQALKTIEMTALLVIAAATVVAVFQEIMVMVNNRAVTLADLLLLFIYLEVFAMVALYLDTGKLPVRMPLYIAIIALARYLILDMKSLDTWRIVGIAVTGLLLAVTVFVIRFGHLKYPYPKQDQLEE
ncbi:phosphate-starvation-inducible protein PsiE [Reinekea blandensis]|uniref:Protein PsiE n=1 Tax=Reinekea blandensis MED297 TaxID=314283 RepID=A4BAC5_9GAMM|nr:phosphate-starvation-inducible PsiE family protein [Reinekea blandensis]EAR10881.1 Phosphate-starvation-inducible E [Reinekea sp. MED297] [Reinekea blandensis MED297]